MTDPRFIDVIVSASEDGGGCEECALRFKMEDEARPIRAVRWSLDDGDGDGEPVVCDVIGLSADGAVPAMGCTIEDSSDGVAVLVWGGDRGLRLTPRDGRPPIAESHIRIPPGAVVE